MMSTQHAGLVIAIVLLAGGPAGCVLVSTSRTDTARDGGRPDSGIVETDSAPFDAGDSGATLVCDRGAVRRSIVEQVILPTLRDFAARAAALEIATASFASSLSGADRDAAREAWRAAMDVWEEAETMQVGPAGMPLSSTGGVIGGMGLRDEIYSWEVTNRCRIDQETVSGDYENVDAFASTESVNARGLDAMEYLLFYEPTTNGCSSTSTINVSGAWAALGEDAIRSRRAQYARSLGVLVRRDAERLRDAWEPSGADFAGQVIRGDGAFPGGMEALNEISNALFYLDSDTKDAKIAGPAALDAMACMASSCAALLESRWAGRSREHLLANLRGFRRMFLGGASAAEGHGFDDLLECHACGGGSTHAQMRSAIDAAITAIEALPSLDAATLASQIDALIGVHAAVKAITDLLKTELVSCLDLDIPLELGTDND
jgi:hypothetical protein